MSIPIIRQWFIDSKLGKIKSDYEFVAEIGRGVFARVFQARHIETNTMRAVKVFIKASTGQLESFTTEIRILRNLDHPNIVNIIETYEDEQFLYLVLEYCSGGNIIERIAREGVFSEQKASWIMRQLFSALIYCHSHNIMHLDIKPENCIYTSDSPDSDIKLIDFGLSSLVPNESEILNDIRGTPFYIAPEVLEKKYSTKSDCWSAGVMMFYLLSGKLPFTGNSTQEIISAVYNGLVRFNDPAFRSISDEAKYLIVKLIHKNVETRFSAQQAYNHQWIQLSSTLPANPLNQEVIENITRFASAKEMKQAALMYIACKLTEDELKNLKEMFRELDTDGDGLINGEDMVRAMARSNCIPAKRLEFIVQGVDMNRNGRIDYREFISSCMGRQVYRNLGHAKAAFRHFDRDGNGFITADELRQVFQSQEFSVEISENVENMIIGADFNRDGRIDYLEFLALLSIQSLHSLH